MGVTCATAAKMPRRTASDNATAQARAAWDRGCAAMDGGEFAAARRWFDRACRFAPSDMTPRLSLAGACLAAGQPQAAARLFEALAEPADAPVAWLGLAASCACDGSWTAAAAALQQALSRYAAGGMVEGTLADAIARGAGYAGWCGLDESGRLLVRASAEALIRLDGRRVAAAGAGYAPPPGARTLSISVGGRALLGSPIRLAEIRRLEGIVEADEQGGLFGWAWHPGDPARDPTLTLVTCAGTRTVRATDRAVASVRPWDQPRGFRVPAQDLAGLGGPIAVRGPDGADLAGSPLSPRLMAIAAPALAEPTSPTRPEARRHPGRAVAVVVPVYRGTRESLACLADVAATVPAGTAVIVVDDASPDRALAVALTAMAATGRIHLLRHSRNLGFPSAVNSGLRVALQLDPPRDLVLLNSDTRMASGWLDRLRAAVHASGDIGTASPLSNDASIASYPDLGGGNPPPAGRSLARQTRLAAQANPEVVVEAPTGIGFCLYLRHECLTQTGLLREDVFAQGYGEENDFCLRATALGWRHVIVPGAYVAHVGGRSFGAARGALLARNLRVLERLHPGYRDRVAGWIARDPLAPARRRLDLLRWDDRRGGRFVLLVTHDDGGGVERCVQDRVALLRAAGHRPILLRPVLDRRDGDDASGRRTLPGLIRLQDGSDPAAFPNLVFRWADERPELLAALRVGRPAAMEVHHLLGHDHAVVDLARALGIGYEMRLHDYAAFCPRVTLTAASDRYCGEPDLAGCVSCVATHGGLLEEVIDPAALHARSAADFAAARRIVAPSADMAARMRRHFPGVSVAVVPHEPDPVGPLDAAMGGPVVRVLVVGAIGRAKGFDVLLACARDAAVRDLPLRFVVVGRTIDDDALLDSGRADITGPYREGEAAVLIAEQAAAIGFVPSLWPETWCFALGEVLRAGLGAVAFDIGAQAERIRRTGRGWLLPLGAPPAAINRLLLRPSPLAVQPNVMQTAYVREMTQKQPMSESSP